MANFTFVPQRNPDGRSQGQRGRKACANCRFKKRRCYHPHNLGPAQEALGRPGPSAHDADQSNASVQVLSSPPAKRPRAKLHGAVVDSPERTQSRRSCHLVSPPFDPEVRQGSPDGSSPDGTPSPRFVGDLNPEARLLGDSTSPDNQQDVSPDVVGVWVQRRLSTQRSPQGASTTFPGNRHERAANQHGLLDSDLLDSYVIAALTDLYFANVHPLLPLVNEMEFRTSLSQHRAPISLIHVLCLIAAKDSAAGPHLKLLELNNAPISVRLFCAHLYESVIASMAAASSKHHEITEIRILALLSLHREGKNGASKASNHICQAIHIAQTLALHLPQPNDHDCELRRIFWCLWTLDRLNAAMNSRPCFLNDLDIGVEPLTLTQSRFPAFDIWFRISQTLNNVIALYRPTNPESVTGIDEMTGFEQYVNEVDGWHLPTATLGTLRVFFLAACVLSYRLKTITVLPENTAARLRQQLAAVQIIRHLGDARRLEALHPLPVTVYAASLALSVSYQQMRYARFSIDQEEAYQDFITSCDILQVLKEKWTAADTIASLSRRTAIELEKNPSLDALRINRRETKRHDPSIEWKGDVARASEGTYAGQDEDFDLFGGMDDISWMYLDGDGPINFDSLPWIGLSTSALD